MAYSDIFTTVKAAFDREGWAFTEVKGREVLTSGFEAHHCRVSLHVQAFPEMNAVSVVSESSFASSDPLKRERLAELVMRVNQTLTVGAFEMNWDLGKLIFRVTNLFPTRQGNIDLIANLVHTVIAEMDRMSPLEALIHRSAGPELAGINIPDLLQRIDLLP
jgi:hypothetical protein